MVNNEDLKQAAPQLSQGWWTSKTPEEKSWYLKFWAQCRR